MTARSAYKLTSLLLGVLLAGGVLELGLRQFPRAVSPRLLILFEPELRARLAETGSLPVRRNFVPLERTDQGPPLYVRKPGTRIVSLDEGDARSQPNADENGFCNPAGRYAALPTIELIAIGDSFTWCHAVKAEQAWVYQLGARTGREVYNLGRGGSGLYEYLQLLQHYGLPKQPRIVVLSVYEGNDLRDAVSYWGYRLELERTGVPPSEEPENLFPNLLSSPLGRRSYAVNLAAAFLTRLWERYTVKSDRIGIDFRYQLELGDDPVPFNVENRDVDEVVHARRLAAGTESLELWDTALEHFTALARERGFSPVVSYIPSAHTSYADRVRFADETLAPLLREFSRTQREFLAQRAESLGYRFHDLTPALRARANRSGAQGLLYDPRHIHLTAEGHRVVADSLARFLAERDPTPAR